MMNATSCPKSPGLTESWLDTDSLRTGAINQEFRAPTTFPFELLPMELQLYMLQYFLISPIPILNAGVPRSQQNHLVKGEEQGLHQIHPSIILTCKFFYAEGVSLLYGRNTFVYTDAWSVLDYALDFCDVEGCQRRAKDKSLPPVLMIEQVPGSTRDWNFALPNFAANINLRLPYENICRSDYECEKLLQIVDIFTNLRTLQLDFMDVSENSHASTPTLGLDIYLSFLPSHLPDLQDSNRSTKALKEIVLTGLVPGSLGLHLVQQYVRLLAPNGRIGVGWGAEGKRYELVNRRHNSEALKRMDLKLLWMNVEQVGTWIAEQHAMVS